MPEMLSIRTIDTDVQPAVLALNNLHAAELSLLDEAKLARLLHEAFHARCIGRVDAFLIAFDETASGYDSPNYLWFKQRYDRFVYIDRVAVAATARGRGHASRLYEDLFAKARQAGHDLAVCEINAEPPNPASDAFHAALGFQPVGQATIHNDSKTVRYFARPLLE